LLWPLAASLGGIAVVGVSAIVAGFDPLEAQTWARWDSFHYESIAKYGYDLGPFECTTGLAACEHAGWFPGYPATFSIPAHAGVSARTSGLVVAWLFTAVTLALVWSQLLAKASGGGPAAGLVFAASVPGMVYLYTVFPMSMLVLFVVLALILLSRRRWVLGGLSGAGAAATYPLGALLAPLAAAWALLDGRADPAGRRIARASVAGGLVLCGLAAVFAFQWLELGDPFAFFDVHDQPLRTPLGGVRKEVQRSFEAGGLELFIAAQALTTTALAAAVAFLLVRKRKTLPPLDMLTGAWVLLVWAVPLSQTDVAVYRANAALLPAALLLPHFVPALRWAFAAAGGALAVPMCVLFFDGTLV
jgi:hypothetical protein